MHKLLLITVGICVIGCSANQIKEKPTANPNVSSEEAGRIFLSELSFLDSVVAGQFNNIPGYPLDRIQKGIRFMEELTGQLSEADGTDIGRLAPVSNDIRRWRAWFTSNKNCLVFSPDSTSIQLDTLCQSLQEELSW